MNAGSIVYMLILGAYGIYKVYKSVNKQPEKPAGSPKPKAPAPFPPIVSKPGQSGPKKSISDLLEELLAEQKKPETVPSKPQMPEKSHPSHLPAETKQKARVQHVPMQRENAPSKTQKSHPSQFPPPVQKKDHTKPELEFDYDNKKQEKQRILEQTNIHEHGIGEIHDIDEEPVTHYDEPEIMGIDARKAMILSEVLKRPEY